MPSIDALPPPNHDQDDVPDEPATAPSGPVVGIIYPPPEVRNIVDKTASFVARNGPEFEARIRQNELGNPKFNFLNSGDPYHAYYQQKVRDIRDGKVPDVNSGALVLLPSSGIASATGALNRLAVTPATAAKQQELLKAAAPAEAPPPSNPPIEFEFIADPPSISALDLDIVKLTAQFVARNGRQFLTDLMNREQRNYQFDFLRPQHSLFQYFTRLLEQYTKVLLPPKELVFKLGNDVKNGVLDQARERAAWHAHQARCKAQDEARIERERVAYAAIDWHDFVVVETVDYPAGEPGDFPPPTTPLEVGARVLAQERGEDISAIANNDDDDTEMQLESDTESSSDEEEGLSTMEDRTNERAPARPDDNRVQDMEEESSEEEEEQKEEPEPPTPLPPRLDKVVVKKYDPKRKPQQTQQPADEWLVSPITGEKIPAHKVAEHVRIRLLDPRWLEQRDQAAAERTDRDEALAPGAAIEASLKQLAERRTDIFGVGDEETAIGKKIGEEEIRRDDRVTWDGHTSSVEAATRAARAHITLEDQIHQIHKVKGLLPDEEKEKIGPKPVTNPLRAPAPPSRPPAPPPISRPAPPPAPPAPLLLPPMPPLMVMPIGSRPPLIATPVAPPFAFPAAIAPVAPPLQIEDDEPAAKRAKTEDSLEPERSWLGRHGAGPVGVQVALPALPERGEWRVDGRLLPFSVSLGITVGELKNQIHRLTNMPQAKQKLNFEGMFMKDSNTLAYYNVPPTAVIQLQVKERGGRKK